MGSRLSEGQEHVQPSSNAPVLIQEWTVGESLFGVKVVSLAVFDQNVLLRIAVERFLADLAAKKYRATVHL